MESRKTLTSIVVTGALALNGCAKVYDSRYDFNGILGNEQVEFKRDRILFFNDALYLTVTKDDGRTITYSDWNNDLKVDKVKVGEDKYYNDVVGQQAIELAQQQFDSYLARILEYKQQEAVDSIK